MSTSNGNGRVKVALAGIGGYGEQYVDALLHDPRASDAHLVGVVEPFPHRCRRLRELLDRRIPVHPTMESLFVTSAVDLVMIATPIHLHVHHICTALCNGANVLCEKPLAGTLDDALQTVRCAADHAPQFVAIGYQWAFSDAVQSLKRDIQTGVFGRPLRMKTIVFFPRGVAYFRRNDWVGRIRTAEGRAVLDSPANNATAHYLHIMLYLLGRTREGAAMPASVQAELYRANDIENYDTAALRVITECGAELLFYTSHAVPSRVGPVCHLEFERARVEYRWAEAGAEFVARFADGRVRSYGDPGLDRNRKIWQSLATARQDRSDRRSVACGVSAALAHTACVTAAQRSPDGGVLTFPPSLSRTLENDGDPILCVEGLAETLIDCFKRGMLPAERGGVRWARRAGVIDARLAVPSVSVRMTSKLRPTPRVAQETNVTDPSEP